MKVKPSSSANLETDAAFHAVEWVREVRDQMYAATSALSPEELIAFVSEAAKATNAGAQLAEPKSDAHTA